MQVWKASAWHLNRTIGVRGTVTLQWLPRKRIPINHAVCSIFVSSDNVGQGLPGVRLYHTLGIYMKELDPRRLIYEGEYTVYQYASSNSASEAEACAIATHGNAKLAAEFYSRQARVLDETELDCFINLRAFVIAGARVPELEARLRVAKIYADAAEKTPRFIKLRDSLASGYHYCVRIPTNRRYLEIEILDARRVFYDISLEFKFEYVLFLLLHDCGPYVWNPDN